MVQPALSTQTACLDYTQLVTSHDEMCSEGQLRPHWQYLINALRQLGNDELAKRATEARRQLRESGVSYNVYEDKQQLSRPWELDPIPLLIDSQEWADIEAGLTQRAELLNLILQDLYGERKLIKQGLLPAELIYAHAGFLRPCDQLKQTQHHQLLIYAADLARGTDGQFSVLSDHTQAPSGIGYTLENRTVMRRILPSLFRDAQVHRLSLFFHTLRQNLNQLASNHNDGNIILLTPGPQAKTYFEHSYLANYLNYTLAQGNDLTVRDGMVWLKSLQGLQQVNVILRYVNDDLCDPLELNHESIIGIPALLEATRQQNVTIANPLGSSILENPALQAFLPDLCQQLLGQPLRLPCVETWWCGQPQACNYVLNNLKNLIIKPISKHNQQHSISGRHLSAEKLQQLQDKIKTHPYLYTAQSYFPYSSTPSLIQNKIEPRPTLLRTFLTARDDSYVVMPGGLSRIARESDSIISNQNSILSSKDTWVLASEPEKQISLWSTSQTQTNTLMLSSRAVENLFWLGRYAERAECFIRLFRTITNIVDEIIDYNDNTYRQCLTILLQALDKISMANIGMGSTDLVETEPQLLNLLLDKTQLSSLHGTLNAVINTGYNARDLLSNDTWRVIHDIEEMLSLWLQYPPSELSQTTDELDRIMMTLSAFNGLVMESMTRQHGWLFLDIGRRIERSLWLIGLHQNLLVIKHEKEVEHLLLESLLISNESIMTYRRHNRTNLHMPKVLELLLFDNTNPRALRYQLEQLQTHINSLPQQEFQHQLSQEQRHTLQALTLLQLSHTEILCQLDETHQHHELSQLLTSLGQLLENLSNTLNNSFFTHTLPPTQLVNYQED